MAPFQNCVRQIQTSNQLLLKREKVDAILIVFLLNYWANHGFKLCQNNPLVIPFQNFVWQSRPRAKINGRCYYLLTFLANQVGCKVLHVLSNPIKPICLDYFSEILFVEEYNICASSYIFFLNSSWYK